MFTHFNEQQRAKMVDVSLKQPTKRIAIAQSDVQMSKETLQEIVDKKIAKGDVFAVAQVAGIMAAKKTAEFIPMCHPIFTTGVDLAFEVTSEQSIQIVAMVSTVGVTGVEMEALTAVSIAALTIYDMCKALDPYMIIGPTQLLQKSGGKSHFTIRSGLDGDS